MPENSEQGFVAAATEKALNERAGFDYIYYVFNTSTNNNQYLYYQLLTRVKKAMEKRRDTGSYETRSHYAYLLSVVDDFLKSK